LFNFFPQGKQKLCRHFVLINLKRGSEPRNGHALLLLLIMLLLCLLQPLVNAVHPLLLQKLLLQLLQLLQLLLLRAVFRVRNMGFILCHWKPNAINVSVQHS
jgi:hypothetical protein